MAFEDWVRYNGKELFNVARTHYRARALGVNTVRIKQRRVEEVMTSLGGTPASYAQAANTPWHQPNYPGSSEFAGFIPLEISGLGDSTLESSPIEYVTGGGHTGKARNKTAALVFSVLIIASTDRGADYGKRYLDRVLSDLGQQSFCSGADLDYWRWGNRVNPEVAHMRDVKVSRGTSVTRKSRKICSTIWSVQFTMTAGDPFEYGPLVPKVTLGADVPTGPGILSYGTTGGTEYGCPEFDYSPIYDPLNPALIAPPNLPDFLPTWWGFRPGTAFQRRWARVSLVEPANLRMVPVISLSSTQEARMVRVGVWPSTADLTQQLCRPLFSAVLSYLPTDNPIYISGEQEASYAWDGVSPVVRRADSLVYSPDARPVKWNSFTDPSHLLITLDLMAVQPSGFQGGGNVRANVSLVQKSD